MTEITSSDPAPEGKRTSGERLSRWLRTGGLKALAGGAVGAALLAGYSYFIGCRTGTCLLTSNVPTASALGGVIGLLLAWPPTKEQARR